MDKNIEPKKITDILDNAEAYIAEMRQTQDKETIPKQLSNYAWECFRTMELDKALLEKLALFLVDKTYRVSATISGVLDVYTYSFFAGVMPKLWDAIQGRGVDTFYILDNSMRADRYKLACDLFGLSGFIVIGPYFDEKTDTKILKTDEEKKVTIVMDPLGAGVDDYLNFEAVEAQLNHYMKLTQNIVYVEKDSRVNYIDKVVEIGKQSNYLCIFRNLAPDTDKVQVIKSRSLLT